MVEFFLVALPGLEDLVKAEVADWFPTLESRLEHGGVTVFAPLATGLSMNLCLKTPTRILMRISTFKSSDFPKLFNKVKEIPWDQWVDPRCELVVHSSTRLSRIKIKRRIDETCADAWMAYQKSKKVTASRGMKANLYVRFVEDECTLSLDTSGERLHKRGERESIGLAPLRETIAAALIQLVGRAHPTEGPSVEIVDPMMGSGTFLLEAAGRDELVNKREFAFETFPVKDIDVPSLKVERPAVDSLVGYELDQKTVTAAKANLKGVKKPSINLQSVDFFKAEPMPKAETARWLFCNPPYDERIKVKEPLANLYVRLFAAADRVVQPDRACFILPSKVVKGKFQLPAGWKVLEKRPFLNGGIPVVAFVFGRPT